MLRARSVSGDAGSAAATRRTRVYLDHELHIEVTIQRIHAGLAPGFARVVGGSIKMSVCSSSNAAPAARSLPLSLWWRCKSAVLFVVLLGGRFVWIILFTRALGNVRRCRSYRSTWRRIVEPLALIALTENTKHRQRAHGSSTIRFADFLCKVTARPTKKNGATQTHQLLFRQTVNRQLAGWLWLVRYDLLTRGYRCHGGWC